MDSKKARGTFIRDKIWKPPESEGHLALRVRRAHVRRPGAMALYRLGNVTERTGLGYPTNQEEVSKVQLQQDLARQSPIKHVRDVAEAQTLAPALDHLKHKRVEQATDLLACRLMAVGVSALRSISTLRSMLKLSCSISR